MIKRVADGTSCWWIELTPIKAIWQTSFTFSAIISVLLIDVSFDAVPGKVIWPTGTTVPLKCGPSKDPRDHPVLIIVLFLSQVKLYQEKRSDLEEQQLHLNVGLQKIRETVQQVEALQKSLSIKRIELEEKNNAANMKLKQMVMTHLNLCLYFAFHYSIFVWFTCNNRNLCLKLSELLNNYLLTYYLPSEFNLYTIFCYYLSVRWKTNKKQSAKRSHRRKSSRHWSPRPKLSMRSKVVLWLILPR